MNLLRSRAAPEWEAPRPRIDFDRFRSAKSRRAALAAPLVLVNLVASYGQFQWALQHLPGGPPVALLFAGTLESIALYISIEANAALLSDDASGRLRMGSYLMGIVVGTLNYWHWSPDWTPTAAAVTFGVLSTLSPFLWAIYSRRTHRNILADRKLIDPRTVRFTLVQWLYYPAWTAGAFRRAVWTRTTDPDVARAEYIARGAVNTNPLSRLDVILGFALPLTVGVLAVLNGIWQLVVVDVGATVAFWAWRRIKPNPARRSVAPSEKNEQDEESRLHVDTQRLPNSSEQGSVGGLSGREIGERAAARTIHEIGQTGRGAAGDGTKREAIEAYLQARADAGLSNLILTESDIVKALSEQGLEVTTRYAARFLTPFKEREKASANGAG